MDENYFNEMPPELEGLVKQAQKMQEDIKKVQEKIETSEFKGSSANGSMSLTLSGTYRIVSLEISDEVFGFEDSELLKHQIIALHNNLVTEIDEVKRKHLEKATGGINIPGLT